MKNNEIKTTDLMFLPEVLEMTKVSRATLYLWIQRGHFPKQRKMGPRKAFWFRKDIQDWMNNLVK